MQEFIRSYYVSYTYQPIYIFIFFLPFCVSVFLSFSLSMHLSFCLNIINFTSNVRFKLFLLSNIFFLFFFFMSSHNVRAIASLVSLFFYLFWICLSIFVCPFNCDEWLTWVKIYLLICAEGIILNLIISLLVSHCFLISSLYLSPFLYLCLGIDSYPFSLWKLPSPLCPIIHYVYSLFETFLPLCV